MGHVGFGVERGVGIKRRRKTKHEMEHAVNLGLGHNQQYCGPRFP